MCSEERLREWLGSVSKPIGIALLMDSQSGKPVGKAYAMFASSTEATRVFHFVSKDKSNTIRIAWSESERILGGTNGVYGVNIIARLTGEPSKLNEICQRSESEGVVLCGTGKFEHQNPLSATQQLHCVVRCERVEQAEKCRDCLAEAMTEIYDVVNKTVFESLMISGFGTTWGEKELKLVFAPFGGLSSVILESTMDGGRVAYAQMRNLSMKGKAVSSLHNVKVGDGDLVEECMISCFPRQPGMLEDGCFMGRVFLDEVATPQQLKTDPGRDDRELFVKNLPLQDMDGDELHQYFEGYGEIEDLQLLGSCPKGSMGEGYVRFAHHDDAVRCIAEIGTGAESDDVCGVWSESERALQGGKNCYRFNIIADLVGKDGSGLHKLRAACDLRNLWLVAEELKQRDSTAPEPQGKQLQFVARYTDPAQLSKLREQLRVALQEIHSKIKSKREKKAKEQTPSDVAPVAASDTPVDRRWQVPAQPWGAVPLASTSPAYGNPWQSVPKASAWHAGPSATWVAPLSTATLYLSSCMSSSVYTDACTVCTSMASARGSQLFVRSRWAAF
eukprot:gnl/MRDRNA2_/MRDRNA2_80279_c0_seq1.p1 gnl/MRDRNA2_/MRDRNA2_80279_c0~~gnl/MRDRNA2_/MRDRNA2_80279_c0_seq1.p1  ORF type:complete len:651 (+),score=118.72 gnl/MRDRNA2_/MRDRNA2_80279_c0_seq1:274-1953(+)